MSCQTFAPAQACWPGVCGVNGTCICSSSTQPQVEFNYFAGISLKELKKNSAVAPCLQDEKVLQILYGITAGLSLVAIIYQLKDVKRLAYIKRLWPSIVTLFCVFFASTYRTFDTGLVFGVDVLFSILISNAYGFSLLSISFIVRDSLYSLVKGEEWSSSSVERLMERYIRMSKLWM